MTDPTVPNGARRAELRKRRQTRRRVTIVALVVLLVVAVGGVFLATRDSGSDSAAPKAATASLTQAAPGLSTSFGVAPLRAATTKGGDIAVYTTPDANTPPTSTLSPQTEYTLPRTLLAFDQYQDWLHVYLPTRPNDATGWIKASDVTLSPPLEYQIKVSLADHKVTLLHNGVVELEAPAATGTGETPTPTGTFYFTDPLDLHSQPGTGYGVFAIGLSGHSNVLQTFAGGDGQIAIHGTDDEGTIGQDVSHGCVRVSNDIIMKLSVLPLGTPIVIT
jgi:lipoprotein-anchoring transpeptidase ErfK/SrfK